MTELTEAEIERLCAAYSETLGEPPGPRPHALLAAAAMLIDARLAPIRALAIRWQDEAAARGPQDQLFTDGVASMLLDALSAHESAPQPHDGTGSQPDDELRSCGCCDGSEDR